MADCMSKGCAHKATVQIGFRVWAPGPKLTHNALDALTGLVLCDACAADATPDDIIPPEGRQIMLHAIRSAGKANPDWNTAELVLAPIIGEPIDPADIGKRRLDG